MALPQVVDIVPWYFGHTMVVPYKKTLYMNFSTTKCFSTTVITSNTMVLCYHHYDLPWYMFKNHGKYTDRLHFKKYGLKSMALPMVAP